MRLNLRGDFNLKFETEEDLKKQLQDVNIQ